MLRNAPVSAWSPGPLSKTAYVPEAEAPSVLLTVGDGDTDAFTYFGFARAAARTSAEVPALVQRYRPAVAFVDADAPHVDAEACCRAANAHGLEVAVLVTCRAPQQVPALLIAGAHAILLKPFAPNLLAGRLGRLVRDHTEHRRLSGWRNDAPFASHLIRRWADVCCPTCQEPNATAFDFTSHRRAWFACLACAHVWIDARREPV